MPHFTATLITTTGLRTSESVVVVEAPDIITALDRAEAVASTRVNTEVRHVEALQGDSSSYGVLHIER